MVKAGLVDSKGRQWQAAMLVLVLLKGIASGDVEEPHSLLPLRDQGEVG